MIYVRSALALLALTASAQAFHASLAPRRTTSALKMALDPGLVKDFPRDFKTIPFGTDYGEGFDLEENNKVEGRKLEALEAELKSTLDTLVANKKKPVFTTALIAGDCVILDAIAKAGYLDKIEVIFIDTFHLFPETLDFLKEVEAHYGFKASVYHCADCNTPEEYWEKYGEDSWMTDIDEYDSLCKVEPLQRALKETEADAWINGRRRDHGAERAALPVWEAFKVNPLAFWSFEVRFRILVGATRRFGFRIS